MDNIYTIQGLTTYRFMKIKTDKPNIIIKKRGHCLNIFLTINILTFADSSTVEFSRNLCYVIFDACES